ncbi:P-loop NTPase fold protein [Crocosphaera sp.]|uniref:P-loop NTPase fold protein n=1 Tax=Crocosphaera sp. TaxID=2729996 RepID=UPI003F2385F0|nr:P-loop NTPase fold protein [Crocosphaera sp.]
MDVKSSQDTNINLFGDYGIKLESHVKYALYTASKLSEDGIIDPANALKAALIVYRQKSSEYSHAFKRLNELFSSLPLKETVREKGSNNFKVNYIFSQSLQHTVECLKTIGETRMWGTDYVGAAILCTNDPSLQQLAKNVKTDPIALKEEWKNFILKNSLKRWSGKELENWWNWKPLPIPEMIPTNSGYRPESTDTEDQLKVKKDAQAFARLIVNSKINPPLSIGLLGDWGSGKSFFMKLIDKEITKRNSLADDAKNPDYCKNIAQIHFNAWHFSDKNLWASIVDTIFTGIWESITPKEKETSEENRKEILENIKIKKGAVFEAQNQLDLAKENLSKVEIECKKAASELTVKAVLGDSLNQLPEMIYKIIQSDSEASDQQQAQQQSDEKPRNQFCQGLENFLPQPFEEIIGSIIPTSGSINISDFQQSQKQLQDSSRRIYTILHASFTRQALSFFCGFLIIGILITGGLAFTSENRKNIAWIGTVTTLTVTVTSTLSKASKLVNELANDLDKTIRKYENKISENKDFQKARRDLNVAEIRLQASKQKLITLEEKYISSDPYQRLVTFLEEQASSNDYRSKQGIISLIRRDFEALSDSMKRVERKRVQDSEQSKDNSNQTITAVDRIVLYIDDLDRCSPEIVVQTLEAIHLLLALDLFVVVVGVDPRWLQRSLSVHYKDLFSEDDQRNAHYRISTPQNYLEKIFQITFAVEPMTEDGFGSYIEDLTKDDSIDNFNEKDTTTLQATSDHNDNNSNDVIISFQKSSTEESKSLEITQKEKDFLKKLHPLITTPRLTKRLVNVYRLIKAGVPDLDDQQYRDTFENELQARYSVLLLLAILFGRSILAKDIFRRLYEKTLPNEETNTFCNALEWLSVVVKNPEFKILADDVRHIDIEGDIKIQDCEEAVYHLKLARYSLITGQVWHTWKRQDNKS